MWLLVLGCGTLLTLSQLLVGATGAIIGNMLPLNALGSIGTLEAGWTLGFSAVGLDSKFAFATGLVFHGIYLVFGGILAAFSWILLQKHFITAASSSR
jgi:uncharacterized membrane protein YbhN (UPF0104 family)